MGRASGVMKSLILAAGASASAAFILGRLYDEGWGVRKSSRRAFEWYKRAAREGSKEALFFVGSAYLRGEGTRRNNAKALGWFRRSAAVGDQTGAYMEALSVFEGIGVSKDEKAGMKLLLKAARGGSGESMDYLAALHIKAGRLQAAKPWAERAIRAGDTVARLRLREIERLSRRMPGAKSKASRRNGRALRRGSPLSGHGAEA
jgi:TPR repeat protein